MLDFLKVVHLVLCSGVVGSARLALRAHYHATRSKARREQVYLHVYILGVYPLGSC